MKNKISFIIAICFLNLFSQDYINDSLAVRAILDSNGLFDIPIDSVSDSSNGRIDTLELVGDGTYATIPKKLTVLPSEIGELSELKYLDLWFNQLVQLPSQIGKLINLECLICSNNLLDSLPSEIGNLSSLKEFYLDHNNIQTLSNEIGNLSNLIVLSMGWNKLSVLPKGIGNLNNLLGLWVNFNNLKRLPPEIGQLNNLVELYLQNNLLSVLPETIINVEPTFCLDVLYNCLNESNLSTSIINWLDKYAGVGWRIHQTISIKNRNYEGDIYKTLFLLFKNTTLSLNLPLSTDETIRLDLLNIKGSKVLTLNENLSRSTLNMNFLSSGMYYLKVTTKYYKIIKKITIVN